MSLWTLAYLMHSMETQAANAKAQSATQQAANVQSKTRLLEVQVERLSLLNQALWEILCDKLGLTDAELMKMAEEIDVRDGKRDGKITARAVRCPQCQRVNNSRHSQCMYCGQPFQSPLFGGR